MITAPVSTLTDITSSHFKLDKLSVCYDETNVENIKKTCGLLLDDKYTKAIPGLTITKSPRYAVSCRIKLPFSQPCTSPQTVIFEAGPYLPGVASYRLDGNPHKISGEGWDDLSALLTGCIDVDPVIFVRMGKITRMDVALDLPGLRLEDVIVRSSRSQKHGVYSNRYGNPETIYIGTPRSRRIVAYDKPIEGSMKTALRIEARLKPGCRGWEVAGLKNPFAKVALIPSNFSHPTGLQIPTQNIADSVRLGGLKRALLPLNSSQRKLLKVAYKQAVSVLPSTDALWSKWPLILVGYGLGQHLGVIPTMTTVQQAALHADILEV